MTMTHLTSVSITLTESSPTQGWQQGKSVQIVDDSIAIYVAEGSAQSLRKIQAAARKIEKLGVAHASLTGDNWDEASQWAFALGFSCVGKLESISFTR